MRKRDYFYMFTSWLVMITLLVGLALKCEQEKKENVEKVDPNVAYLMNADSLEIIQ